MNGDEERTFEQELTSLLNKFSQENISNTPDFLLATYLCYCLDAFNQAIVEKDHKRHDFVLRYLYDSLEALGRTVNQRSEWYGEPSEPQKPKPKAKDLRKAKGLKPEKGPDTNGKKKEGKSETEEGPGTGGYDSHFL